MEDRSPAATFARQFMMPPSRFHDAFSEAQQATCSWKFPTLRLHSATFSGCRATPSLRASMSAPALIFESSAAMDAGVSGRAAADQGRLLASSRNRQQGTPRFIAE